MYFIFLAVVALASAESQGIPKLDFVGEWSLKFRFEDVGGLSGSAFDREEDLCFVVPDGDAPEPVFYSTKLGFSQGRGISSISMLEKIPLKTPGGEPAPEGFFDPEALAFCQASGTFYYANERDHQGIPSVRQVTRDGEWVRQLLTPKHHTPAFDGEEQIRGVRPDMGYQGIAILPGLRLLVAPQAALAQDVWDNGFSPIRMTLYQIKDRADGLAPSKEYVYHPDNAPEGWTSVGLSDMAAIPGETDRFLTLETFANPGQTAFFSRIFIVDLADSEYPATEVLDLDSISGLRDYFPLKKELVRNVDASSLGLAHLDKMDHMNFGPDFEGFPILTVGSDDDFQPLPRRTQTLAFQYKAQ